MNNIYVTLLASFWVCAILSDHMSAAWRLDCSKFVFAPKCRGVAAKRAQSSSSNRVQSGGFLSDPRFHDIADRFAASRDALSLTEGEGHGVDAQWLSRLAGMRGNKWPTEAQPAPLSSDSASIINFLRKLTRSDLSEEERSDDVMPDVTFDHGY